MRDSDIRASLTQWLHNEYRDQRDDTAFYEEFEIPRPTARADLAVVNGALVGFEIKSDVDSLARLPSQIKSYGHVFDRMYLVTTENRAARLSDEIPAWWGIVRVKSDGTVNRNRKSKINRQVNLNSLLFLLNIYELKAIADNINVSIESGLRKEKIVDKITKSMRKTQLLAAVRDCLKARKLPLKAPHKIPAQI